MISEVCAFLGSELWDSVLAVKSHLQCHRHYRLISASIRKALPWKL